MVAALVVGGGIFLWTGVARLPAGWIESGRAAVRDERSLESATDMLRPKERSRTETKPVQVVAAPVHQGNVPIYISGLGTIQAFYTIKIKAQVDGVILKMPFAEGQDVKEGDTLVLIDASVYQARLEQAQAQKQRAIAQLENAKTNLWRDEELLKHDFATQKQADQDRMLVGQYTADIAQYEADIKYREAQLAYTNIRSPINGRIGVRKVDPGNLIRAQDNIDLVTLVQLQPISVIITVPAKELAGNGVSLGLVDLPVTAYAENGITPLGRGRVHTVNIEVDQTTGTVKLKASFDNEHYKLWPGDFVDCKITVEQRSNGLTVPTAAIRHGPRGDFVWLIQSDSTVVMRRVRVRQTIGGTAVIDAGLEANEKVVLDGYARLVQGSVVEIAPARQDDASKLSRSE